MTIKKISYGIWEGDPAILVYDDEGLEGYAYLGGEWRQGHSADIGMKANALTERQFKEAFPDLELPAGIVPP
jgi:hypothetical protein